MIALSQTTRGNILARLAVIVLVATAADACRERSPNPPRQYALGRDATAAEIAAVDIDVGPDGVGLPVGHGSAIDGAAIYAQKCASCHGARGEGIPPAYPRLIGRDTSAEGFRFGTEPFAVRTIGNYWPYATTVFDYVRRAMPLSAPGSLTNDEVYAITAYLLAGNQVIAPDVTLDSASLQAVRMPYVDRFVRDDRRGGHEIR
ncbi:MAG: cytochrome c [Gemmatimonadaceae bacterium]